MEAPLCLQSLTSASGLNWIHWEWGEHCSGNYPELTQRGEIKWSGGERFRQRQSGDSEQHTRKNKRKIASISTTVTCKAPEVLADTRSRLPRCQKETMIYISILWDINDVLWWPQKEMLKPPVYSVCIFTSCLQKFPQCALVSPGHRNSSIYIYISFFFKWSSDNSIDLIHSFEQLSTV